MTYEEMQDDMLMDVLDHVNRTKIKGSNSCGYNLPLFVNKKTADMWEGLLDDLKDMGYVVEDTSSFRFSMRISW